VLLGQRAGAGPDLVRHVLVEDLLADLLQLGHVVARDERERRGAGLRDVLRVLDAGQAEVDLLPRGLDDVARGEEVALVQPAREVVDRRALHDRVVDVEERRGVGVGIGGEPVLDLARGRRSLAGEHRPRPQVRPRPGDPLAGHDPNLSGSPSLPRVLRT
jgi:hypothetical protein